ncbi:hypothetical protein E2C01_074281 [Portunus trituberculatus]|uniref:Uncharacterized protein n=1 Tax=Portunus trituberculatus TaxID=210409 RepID=A0A5B7IDW7_PORTR|nr:hypothetical protein [Portunus trituberculatus]
MAVYNYGRHWSPSPPPPLPPSSPLPASRGHGREGGSEEGEDEAEAVAPEPPERVDVRTSHLSLRLALPQVSEGAALGSQ